MACLLTKEEQEKLRKAFQELQDYIDERHRYYYTNPPKGIKVMSPMELFEMGTLDIGEFYNNPIVRQMEINSPQLLAEAEYATYPIYTTIEYVSKALRIPLNQFSVFEKKDGTDVIKLLTINDEDVIEEIDKAMHLCGYYKGYSDFFKKDKRFLLNTYEPKYSDTVNDDVFEEKFLYHLSPLPYKNRILKYGLVPKSSNSVFKYPDRTYFFLGSNGKEEVKSWIPVFKQKNKKYGDKPYCLYTIDVSRIPRNIDFYSDPNLKNAIFTMDNISPKAIINVEIYDD